jgi:hypothetical protein
MQNTWHLTTTCEPYIFEVNPQPISRDFNHSFEISKPPKQWPKNRKSDSPSPKDISYSPWYALILQKCYMTMNTKH